MHTDMSANIRILVVDDQEHVLLILHDALAKLGDEYEVAAARNGREALDEFRKAPFNLVITDLVMPGMSGVELTRAIMALNPDTQMIWITAHGFSEEINAEAVRLSVCRCPAKPIEIGEIRRIVRDALQKVGDQNGRGRTVEVER